MEATPWYRSTAAIVVASILLPPLGLFLLLTRPGMESRKKVTASLCIVLLACVYVAVYVWAPILPMLPSLFVSNPDAEAHYDQLERHRAEQRAAAGTPEPQPVAEQGAATGKAESNGAAVAAEASSAPVASKSARTYWIDYRGPGRNGRYDEVQVLTSWPAGGPQLMWKQPVGIGWASFVVAEGRAFTIEQRRSQEIVAAYDVETGREAWTHGWEAEFVESMGGNGPRATPTWDQGRLYALGARGDLRSIDAKTGKLLWARNILSDNQAQNLEWGMSGSPLIVDDKVIVLPGGGSGKSVVAYNKMTGEPVWRALNDRQAYTSPMLVELAGRRQVLVVSASRAVGLDPADGALLWEYPWNTQMGINCSQPIVVDRNRFFISSGYGKGAALVEVTPNGKGYSTRTVWENTNMKNKFNSSVLHDGHIYGLDEGILTCVDVTDTGNSYWRAAT
jgi:outer membrane protein assembly factor BamB